MNTLVQMPKLVKPATVKTKVEEIQSTGNMKVLDPGLALGLGRCV